MNQGQQHSVQPEMLPPDTLSALADGQLQGDAFAQAVQWACCDDAARATWATYHLVGDVLRSSELARPASLLYMERLRAQLAREPLPPQATAVPLHVAPIAVQTAANASVFRWKMAAGVASIAAVMAVGWTVALQGQGPATTAGAQLALSAPRAATPVAAVSQQAETVSADASVAARDGQSVMLRDPRLDELLAAHQQMGAGTTALQMPAGFLRNATFAQPAR